VHFLYSSPLRQPVPRYVQHRHLMSSEGEGDRYIRKYGALFVQRHITAYHTTTRRRVMVTVISTRFFHFSYLGLVGLKKVGSDVGHKNCSKT
jgi:hypothetical protein